MLKHVVCYSILSGRVSSTIKDLIRQSILYDEASHMIEHFVA